MDEQSIKNLDRITDLFTKFQQGQTDFDNLLLKEANFQAQFLPFISLKKACLVEADWRHSVLPGANLSGATLRLSNFEHANLLSADLSWAQMSHCNFGHALLTFSTLAGADLANAQLTGASLAHANLHSANLRNANLAGANLKWADLSRANLFGARIEPQALAETILDYTVMPNGECRTNRHRADSKTSVPVANLMSYTRVANSLNQLRDSQNQSSENDHPNIGNKTQVDTLRQVAFQFSEKSGDLDLKLVVRDSSRDSAE